MAQILEPVVMDAMVDRCKTDLQVVSLLSQTCKAYHEALPCTDNIKKMREWLNERERKAFGHIWVGPDLVFYRARVAPFSPNKNGWKLQGECGRRSTGLFDHVGVIRLGKCVASLIILGEGWGHTNKDSFHGILDLGGLNACFLWHTILCHQIPENLPPLCGSIRHRHRDDVPWTVGRVFSVWRSVCTRKPA